MSSGEHQYNRDRPEKEVTGEHEELCDYRDVSRGKSYDRDKPEDEVTGGHEELGDFQDVCCRFGKYEITVRVTSANEFVGIVEVRVNKGFLAHKRMTIPKGFHDVDEYYQE